jgi:hypothetical protein
MVKKDEQKVLNPEVIDKTDITPPDIKINALTENPVIVFENKSEDSDSYFRSIIDGLNTTKDIETKTELLDVAETYGVSKMDFLGEITEEPTYKLFMAKFKVNRVSLKRRGRQELIMALVERQQEREREAMINNKKAMGII